MLSSPAFFDFGGAPAQPLLTVSKMISSDADALPTIHLQPPDRAPSLSKRVVIRHIKVRRHSHILRLIPRYDGIRVVVDVALAGKVRVAGADLCLCAGAAVLGSGGSY